MLLLQTLDRTHQSHQTGSSYGYFSYVTSPEVRLAGQGAGGGLSLRLGESFRVSSEIRFKNIQRPGIGVLRDSLFNR